MKKNYMKTLLAAVLLAGSNGVWADTTTLLEYGTNDVSWTQANLAEWTAGGSPSITDGVVQISGGNGGYSTSKTIEPTANAIINVEAVWRGASSTGRNFAAGNGSYFRFGNIIVAQNDQDKQHGYGFSGLDNISSVTKFTAGNYRVDVTSSEWLLIEAEINTASNTLTSFTIKNADGSVTYVSQSNVSLSGPDYTTVAFGYKKGGGVSTTNKEQLKYVKITQTTQSVTTADYTIKYVCNGQEVKDNSIRTGVVGDIINLSASDTKDFYSTDGTAKYIYSSDDASGKTIDNNGNTVVTVTFREAQKYSWTAKSSVGTYSISGETFEGDKASAKYPIYQLVDGMLWTKATAGNASYVVEFTPTNDQFEYTIDYTMTDIPAMFYDEVENISGMGVVARDNAEARSSYRAAGYSAIGETVITNLSVGKYRMVASFYSPTSNGGNYKFYTGNRVIWEKETGNANATVSDVTFVMAKDGNIKLGQCSATAAVDYIYIQYLGAPTDDELAEAQAADKEANTPVTVEVTAGYATLCSDKPLDLSAVEAYIVSGVEDKTLTLTKVESAPANTGLLIKGNSNYEIPVVISSQTSVAGNLLVGVTEDTEITSGYVLQNQEENGLGFYLVTEDNAKTVPAGKAYLNYTKSEAKALYFDGGDATAIEAISALTSDAVEGIYTVGGAKVESLQKGINILKMHNGETKKVIVK